MKEEKQIKPVIEALLFASDSPITVERIRSVIEKVELSRIRECIDELNREYEQQERCFHITEIAGGYQLATKAQFAPWIKKLYKGKRLPRLSAAALETLAIVAFRGPIIRVDIEAIRGVNVEGVLKTLLERKMVTVVGRQEGPGRPLLYATTQDFLIYFGLNSLEDLPRPKELEELMGHEENSTEQELSPDQEESSQTEIEYAPQ